MAEKKKIACNLFLGAVRLLVGGVFLYSGFIKALDHDRFQIDVYSYRILGYQGSVIVGVYLPYLEIICGLALLTKRLYAGALLILTLLMLTFIIFISSAWIRGLNINCGCFGWSENPTEYLEAIIRDVVLLMAIGILYFKDIKTSRNNPSISAPHSPIT